jgi:hypothetical protein
VQVRVNIVMNGKCGSPAKAAVSTATAMLYKQLCVDGIGMSGKAPLKLLHTPW